MKYCDTLNCARLEIHTKTVVCSVLCSFFLSGAHISFCADFFWLSNEILTISTNKFSYYLSNVLTFCVSHAHTHTRTLCVSSTFIRRAAFSRACSALSMALVMCVFLRVLVYWNQLVLPNQSIHAFGWSKWYLIESYLSTWTHHIRRSEMLTIHLIGLDGIEVIFFCSTIRLIDLHPTILRFIDADDGFAVQKSLCNKQNIFSFGNLFVLAGLQGNHLNASESGFCVGSERAGGLFREWVRIVGLFGKHIDPHACLSSDRICLSQFTRILVP